MIDNFKRGFDLVLGFEGGFTDDPNDSGGKTKYGISKKAYPDEDIVNLTLSRAKELYKRDYWDKCRCDQLPDGTDIVVFDTAVNMGVGYAAKTLQKAVGATADGKIGPQTLSLVNYSNPQELLANYMTSRMLKYHRIAVKNTKNEKFVKGWFRRVFSLYSKII
jgi:lysozyme family protein